LGNGDEVVIIRGTNTVSLKSISSDCDAVATRILKFDSPAFVGVPLRTPEVDNDNPEGTEPDRIVQVRVPVPPLAVNV